MGWLSKSFKRIIKNPLKPVNPLKDMDSTTFTQTALGADPLMADAMRKGWEKMGTRPFEPMNMAKKRAAGQQWRAEKKMIEQAQADAETEANKAAGQQAIAQRRALRGSLMTGMAGDIGDDEETLKRKKVKDRAQTALALGGQGQQFGQNTLLGG